MHGLLAHATKREVSIGGASEGMAGAQAATDAWRQVRSDPDIQFAPVKLPDAEPAPGWLARALEWLADLFAPAARFVAANWGMIWPVLGVLAVLLAAYVAVRLVAPDLVRRRRRETGEPEAQDWRPPEDAALALLEEADRLAGAGRFAEATHLLLTRSVGQIAVLRPELVEPSTTAREIAQMRTIGEAARAAFAIIAARVERSLFALRALDADDWQAARAAYADFALATERRLAA